MSEHDPQAEPPFDPIGPGSPPSVTPPVTQPVIEHETRAARAKTVPARSGGTPGWVTLLLFLILAGSILAAWTNPKPPERDDLVEVTRQIQAEGQTVAGLSAQMQGLGQQMQALSDRVEKLEKAPAPAPADATPAPPPQSTSGPQVADLGDLPKRVDDLSTKVAALESQPAAAPADNGAAQQAVAALSQKLDQVEAADKAALDQAQAAQKDAIAPLDGRIAKLEQGAGSVEDAASRATRLERIQAAVVALEAGQKLGAIPNAPPALAKFENQAPPTEAMLRDSFPALAAHARSVSEPDSSQKSFLQRAFARLQESVTVRQGNDVIVGNPAAGILSDAEIRVQNGDLAGAVARLGALRGPAAAAMQGWVDQAQSLIAARAALASLAARG